MVSGKCYLVTGGAGGIGEGIARAILEAGGRVAILDIDELGVTSTANRLDPDGHNCIPLACNIANSKHVAVALNRALGHFGRLDGAVNNAGIVALNPASDATSEEWERHLKVNVTGAFIVSQRVAAHLKKHGGGAIVNVSSNCGKVGYPNMAAYNASKAALISMTRSLSGEWAEHNINVNAVCPGGVDTEMLSGVAEWMSPRIDIPAEDLLADMKPMQLDRKILPIEVGRVVAFLLSDHALIIRGQAINVDGGDTPY
ncbi:MAG: SDR family oxidoreductase [Pseudomonadota bacterium]